MKEPKKIPLDPTKPISKEPIKIPLPPINPNQYLDDPIEKDENQNIKKSN